MRIFGGEQVSRMMTMFNLPEDVPLEHGMVSRAIQQAQVKVEGFHFDSRKHLVEYDDVLNKQREIIYKRRRGILEGVTQKDTILDKIAQEVTAIVGMQTKEEGGVEEEKVAQEIATIIPFDPQSMQQLAEHLRSMKTSVEVTDYLTMMTKQLYEQREQQVSPEIMRQIERWVSLQAIDSYWMEHLDAIDDLREGIGLRGYGQREPLVEYKHEAFTLFEQLVAGIDREIVRRIYRVEVKLGPPPGQTTTLPQGAKKPKESAPTTPLPADTAISKSAGKARTNAPSSSPKEPVKQGSKIGRNDPCPCGALDPKTGKPYKYKKCGLINAPYHKG